MSDWLAKYRSINREDYTVLVAKLDFLLEGLRGGQQNAAKKNAEFIEWRDKRVAKDDAQFDRIEHGQNVLCERLDSLQQEFREALPGLYANQLAIKEKLAALEKQAFIHHEFIVDVIGSLEHRLMEMEVKQVRWVSLYEQALTKKPAKRAKRK